MIFLVTAPKGRREVRLNDVVPESGLTGYVTIDIETACKLRLKVLIKDLA